MKCILDLELLKRLINDQCDFMCEYGEDHDGAHWDVYMQEETPSILIWEKTDEDKPNKDRLEIDFNL